MGKVRGLGLTDEVTEPSIRLAEITKIALSGLSRKKLLHFAAWPRM